MWQVRSLVDVLVLRVFPVLDRAAEHSGQDRAGQLEAVADAAYVVRDRGSREGPRDLDATVAARELVLAQRRVAGAEVDRPVGDRRDPAAATDAAVDDLRRLVGLGPFRHQWYDEGAACPHDRSALLGRVRGREALSGRDG